MVSDITTQPDFTLNRFETEKDLFRGILDRLVMKPVLYKTFEWS